MINADHERRSDLGISVETGGEDDDVGKIISIIKTFAKKAYSVYPFFLLIFGVLFIVGFFYYAISERVYTAEAIIGPPKPSPINSMLSSMSSSVGSSFINKIAGGNGGTSDLFQEYQQLLYSPELATQLVNQDHILELIYAGKWDAAHNRWMNLGRLHHVASFIYGIMRWPTVDNPNVDTLGKHLKKNLTISQSSTLAKGMAGLSLSGGQYFTISYSARDPADAEKILNIILKRADNIIRQRMQDDVFARILYIKNELQLENNAEQRTALINILEYQEELKIIMVADKRFSYDLISTPFASEIPISPMAPARYMMIIFGVSLLLFMAAVYINYTYNLLLSLREHLRVFSDWGH
jgi:hypothetical protein